MKKITFILPAFVLSLLFGSASCQQAAPSKDAAVNSVDAADFKKLVDTQEGILLDVRTPEEFNEAHIEGALNIDFHGENFKSFFLPSQYSTAKVNYFFETHFLHNFC